MASVNAHESFPCRYQGHFLGVSEVHITLKVQNQLDSSLQSHFEIHRKSCLRETPRKNVG